MKTTLAAIALASATSAHAEFFSGNDLLEALNGNEVRHALALGYIAGAFDAATGTKICPPANVKLSQVRDMTRRALEMLPAERHASADIFVVSVTANAWPCKPQKRGSDI